MQLLTSIFLFVTLAAPAACGDVDAAESFAQRLSGDDWKQRQAAEEELVRMGPAARPIIAKLLDNPTLRDPEVRLRLEVALRRIEENRVAGPSFVTLHVKDAAAGDVATELARQAGSPLLVRPEDLWNQARLPRVTINLDRQPFWRALRELAGQAGVGVALTEDGWCLQRGGGGAGVSLDAPAVLAGPFLVVAGEVWRSRSVKSRAADGEGAFDGKAVEVAGSDRDQFGITLTVLAEPKLRVLRSAEGVRLAEAVDDHGNPLLPEPGGGGVATARGGRTAWVYGVPLQYPRQRPGVKIARLRGDATFTVQTRADRLELNDVLTAGRVTRDLTDGRVTAQVARQTDGRTYTLTLSVAPLPVAHKAGAAEPAAQRLTRWMVYQQSAQRWLRLEDAAGRPLPRTGFGSRVNGDEVELTLQFSSPQGGANERAGEAAKLVWEVPTATEEVEVAFEFRDVPMP